MLYKKVDVPDLETIVDELLTFVQPQISSNLRHWDLPLLVFRKTAPTFFTFMTSGFFRTVPILLRFYNTPPYYNMGPHIDNLGTAINKIGFNIPLLGTKNTLMNYYETDDENILIVPAGGLGKEPAQIVKDNSKLRLIDSVEIDKPTILRTDVMHDVINQNASYRLVLGMKFAGNTFEEVLSK